MTIVCAKKDGDVVWIASDSRMTSHRFIDPGIHEKWIEVDGWWFGLSGSMMMDRIIRQACAPPSMAELTIHDISDAVHQEIRRLNWTPDDEDRGSPKWFAAAFIAVSPALDVFEVFGTGAVNPVGENFIACGAGSDYAYGVWHGITNAWSGGFIGDTADAMRIAVEAAITYNSSCGGPVFSKVLERAPQ